MYVCIWTYKLYIFLCVDPTWSSTLRGLRSLRSLVPSGDVPMMCQGYPAGTESSQAIAESVPYRIIQRKEWGVYQPFLSFNINIYQNAFLIKCVYIYSHISGSYCIWLYRCLFLYWYASMSTRILVIKHVMYRHVSLCVSINYKSISMQYIYISTCALCIYI